MTAQDRESAIHLARREFLTTAANGIGGVALASLLAGELQAAPQHPRKDPLAPKTPHFAAAQTSKLREIQHVCTKQCIERIGLVILLSQLLGECDWCMSHSPLPLVSGESE